MDVIFFGHDITYSRLARALADELPPEFRLVFYCNKPGLAWFARRILGLPTIRAGSGRLSSRHKPVDKPPFELDLRFYSPAPDMVPYWNSVAQWHHAKASAALRDTKPAIFVSPGEYRVTEQAFQAIAEKQYPETPIIFFEAGPGPYVYLDSRGVNANASFAHGMSAPRDEKMIATRNTGNQDHSAVNGHAFASKMAKIIDVAWVLAIEAISSVNEFSEYRAAIGNRIRIQLNKWRPKKPEIDSETRISDNYLLFVDQVGTDVNATHFGCSESIIVGQISELMDENPDWRLVWRPHPLERREDCFKQISDRFPGRVFLSSTSSYSEELKGAMAVLTVNSNGGLDALLVGLPVLLFGASYYQRLLGVTRSPKELSEMILSSDLSCSDISNAAERFISDSFIPLDYRGQNFANTGALASSLLAHIRHPGGLD
ncbi:hypothetical protein [uncultured Parasphingorhabdus sp.]|uniref:capsular polysaccharide export protein, LipB/KpsS family n=1 Tax=uncultured Parasphingorhabdus sp. TaxID=2709694 RepID=UPI0030DA9DE7